MRGTQSALAPDAFVAWLEDEGSRRYHDAHPFHVRMHDGTLTRDQIQQWVLNRWYYQTRIPIKDALILAKSEDPAFRRRWFRRIHDHDGTSETDGGLALWLELARGVGLDVDDVRSCRAVLPGVRFACDAYVQLVRDGTLLEALASSLTEAFAPDLMSRRLDAFERHYPWVDPAVLAYFRSRVPRARRDADETLELVVEGATTLELQRRCVAALVRKTEVLWHLLDCVHTASVAPGGDDA